MSEHQEGSSSDAGGATAGSSSGADSVTEPTQPQPTASEQPISPFARPPGYEGSVGYGPPPVPPAPPEPRFAGAPYGNAPTSEYPAYPTSYGQPVPPWQPPGASYPPPGIPWGAAPEGPVPPDPPRSRKPWILVTILVLALVAGGTTIGLVSTDSKSSTPPAADPNLPTPLNSPSPAPSTGPSPNSSGGPSSPLPNVGIPTPPGLLAIGYHAYSSGLREPADVAIDSAEEVQFKKDGLERIVGLNALTLGTAGVTSDDYDADISILRFKTAAGAKAELDYSNMRNKQDAAAKVISLPGLPDVTAFLNTDASGYSIGAFASVGRYQVVLILGGLSPNVPTNSTVLAAEAARVMKALLADAASIEPQDSGGGSGQPQAPDQTPFVAPTPTPSGIHA